MHSRHSGCGERLETLGDAIPIAQQRGLIDEVERNGRHGVRDAAGSGTGPAPSQRFRRSPSAPQARCRSSFTTAHATQIESCVATDLIGADARIGAHDQRHAGDDVETVEALADLARPDSNLLQLLRRELGGVEDGQPAVGQFPGQLEVLRSDRREVDRDVRADRCDGQLERLAGAIRQRQLVVLALKLTVDRGQRCVTIAMYSRVRASGLSNRTPCQPSETCGPETPRPSRKRPPVNTSRLAAVIAVIARCSGGDLHHRRADIDGRGLGSEPGKDGGAIRAVRLGRPDHSETERFGMLGQPQLPARIIGSDQIAEVEPRRMADTLAAVMFVRCSARIACSLPLA